MATKPKISALTNQQRVTVHRLFGEIDRARNLIVRGRKLQALGVEHRQWALDQLDRVTGNPASEVRS